MKFKYSLIVSIALTAPIVHACKVTITNNTDTTYQLRSASNGAPQTVAPGKSVSFGDNQHMAHFIVAQEGNDIRDVTQTTCGGNKSEKKLTMQGIIHHRLGKHQDKFSIKKL